MADYQSVTWTAGDIITEAKLDAMVSNDQAENAHPSLVLSEISSPSTPAENKLHLFAKDVSGVAALHIKDDAGVERRIPSLKSGNFTRDTAAATASVAYTGVGFKPRAIFFLAIVDTTTKWSVGFDDTTSAKSLGGTGSDSNITDNGASSITLRTSAGNSQTGVIASFDTDGFTITWTKNGSPTGTASIYYLALA